VTRVTSQLIVEPQSSISHSSHSSHGIDQPQLDPKYVGFDKALHLTGHVNYPVELVRVKPGTSALGAVRERVAEIPVAKSTK
jgi:hypothetical protein